MADATWYGSFRGGIENVGKAGDAKSQTSFKSTGSRWGVKGSNEISDGLSAVYRYEESLNLGTASLDAGNRLSYVGVSGGFGTITLGRVWSAGYNSVGAITDNSFAYGDARVPYRESNMISYSVGAGNFSMQADVKMDSGLKENSVDMAHVGASLDAGIAKFAVYAKDLKGDTGGTKVEAVKKELRLDDPATTNVDESKQKVTDSNPINGRKVVLMGHDDGAGKARITAAATEITFGGITAHIGMTRKNEWKSVATGLDDDSTMDTAETIAVENDESKFATAKVKHEYLHYGVRGAVGDTGINYLLQVTRVEEQSLEAATATEALDTDIQQVGHEAALTGNQVIAGSTAYKTKTTKSSPVVLGISKSLGGGASVHFEYMDPDKEDKPKKTLLTLKVDF